MKYIANPVEVDAFVITNVEAPVSDGSVGVTVDVDGKLAVLIAGADMTARYAPVPGDYWVVQSDGYLYLNPKAVFERKYSPA